MCKVNGQNWSVYDPSKEPTNKTIPGFPPNEENLYRLVNMKGFTRSIEYIGFLKKDILNKLGTPSSRRHNPIDEFPNEAIEYNGIKFVFNDEDGENGGYEMLTITGKDFFISNKFKLQVGECIPYELLRDHKYKYSKNEAGWIYAITLTLTYLKDGAYKLIDYFIEIDVDSNGRITRMYQGPG